MSAFSSKNVRELGSQVPDFLHVCKKSDVLYCFVYILPPLCCTEMGLNLKHAKGSHHENGMYPSLLKSSLQERL